VGDVLEPQHGVTGIGSGGDYARSAALALMNETALGAEDVVRKSLSIAASICIYTNDSLTIETIGQ
jgi:ATP-dependent HslUV protease subunit HslV